MEKRSESLAAERVPRYTSYPTAPHFHAGIGEEQYKGWLGNLNDSQPLSLYFHIPYCRQLCWFCGCHTKIVNHYDPVEKYLDLMMCEIALLAGLLPKAPVTHIHYGGGSPTIISATDFSSLMDNIRQSFIVSSEAEIAIEIDPRTVDVEKIKAYATSGVTRASLGVQDFTLRVQEAINRIQPYDMVLDVTRMLRKQGINALNVDLIYGLPHQTLKTTRQTIEQTLTLEPDRISLFGYAHVPWMKKHQQLVPEEALPTPSSRAEMFEAASLMLTNAGYVAIGLDHFAKPEDSLTTAMKDGKLQRNFQGYTTDTAPAVLGMGVSSISSLPQGYLQNTSSNIDYSRALRAKQLPVARGIMLTQDDINRREIIMSLMCRLHAPVPEKLYVAELQRLKSYFEAGDAIYNNERLTINPKAQKHLRLIASVFDCYMSDTGHRYSQAV